MILLDILNSTEYALTHEKQIGTLLLSVDRNGLRNDSPCYTFMVGYYSLRSLKYV